MEDEERRDFDLSRSPSLVEAEEDCGIDNPAALSLIGLDRVGGSVFEWVGIAELTLLRERSRLLVFGLEPRNDSWSP